MFKRFKLLYSPDDIAGTGLPSGKEDVVKFLGMDDDEKVETIPLEDKKEKKDEKEEKSDEDDDEKDEKETKEEDEELDELKEIEESLEEDKVTEDKLELVAPVSRKEILKKYPNLFKEFPYLERSLYRNHQFTDMFPDVKDAQLALEKSETLDKFDQDLLAGNTRGILEATKNTDPRAFNKIVDNYMSTLANVDRDAYFHVLGNSIKQTIISMVREGRKSDNEALQNAAAILNNFVFGTTEFEPPKNLSKDDEKEDSGKSELENEKRQLAQERFSTANADVERAVNNSLKATIDANLDTKNSMSEFVKKAASREAFEHLETLISNDKQFATLIDKLWDNAEKNKYSKESTDKIRNAFFAKARTLLPAVIKKARIEALRGMGKRVGKEKDEEEVAEKGPDQPERKRSNNSNDSKEGPKKGETTLEYLMRT